METAAAAAASVGLRSAAAAADAAVRGDVTVNEAMDQFSEKNAAAPSVRVRVCVSDDDVLCFCCLLLLRGHRRRPSLRKLQTERESEVRERVCYTTQYTHTMLLLKTS